MLSFSLVAEALAGLIYHRPSGENSNFHSKQSLSEFKSCEHTHFDDLLRSATLLHFMTDGYIDQKWKKTGLRKLHFYKAESIEQWNSLGGYNGGILSRELVVKDHKCHAIVKMLS